MQFLCWFGYRFGGGCFHFPPRGLIFSILLFTGVFILKSDWFHLVSKIEPIGCFVVDQFHLVGVFDSGGEFSHLPSCPSRPVVPYASLRPHRSPAHHLPLHPQPGQRPRAPGSGRAFGSEGTTSPPPLFLAAFSMPYSSPPSTSMS